MGTGGQIWGQGVKYGDRGSNRGTGGHIGGQGIK